MGLDAQGRVVTCVNGRVAGFDPSGHPSWNRDIACSDDGYGLRGQAVLTDVAPITELAVADGGVLARMPPSQYPHGDSGRVAGGPFDVLVELGGAPPPACAPEIRFMSPAGLSPILHDVNLVWAPFTNHTIAVAGATAGSCANSGNLAAVSMSGATQWKIAALPKGHSVESAATDAMSNHDATAIAVIDNDDTIRLYELPVATQQREPRA